MSARQREAPQYNAEATARLRDLFREKFPGQIKYSYVHDLINRQNADPNTPIYPEGTVLQEICDRMHHYNIVEKRDQIEFLKIFKFLLTQPNIDVRSVFANRQNLLVRAALLPDSKFLHVLLQKSHDIRADINRAITSDSCTPLMYSCELENKAPLESIQYLIDAGADCNLKSRIGFTPIIYAISSSTREDHSKLMAVLGELFRKKADANLADLNGETPFHWAIKRGSGYSVYARLLQGGARVDIPDNRGRTPAEIAHTSGNDEALWAIQRHLGKRNPKPSGLNLEATREFEHFLNSKKSLKFSFEEIYDFVMKGANPNVLLANGYTFLHNLFREMPKSGYIDPLYFRKALRLFQLFLDQPNINVHAVSEGQPSILHRTLCLPRSDFLHTLIMEKGRDILEDINEPLSASGYLPLHFVCGETDVPLENVRYLLDARADCNLKTTSGLTPLKCAVMAHYDDFPRTKSRLMFILNELFRNGANPNIQGNDGRTVLHDAFAAGKGYDVCTRLLEEGAKLDIPDAKGQTPLGLAWNSENDEQLDAIETWLMKRDSRLGAALAMKRAALQEKELRNVRAKHVPHHMF